MQGAVRACLRAAAVPSLPARDACPSPTPPFPSPEPPVPSPGLFGEMQGQPGAARDRSSQSQGFPSHPPAPPYTARSNICHGISSALPNCPSLRPPCPPRCPPGQAGAGTHPLPTPLPLATSPGLGNLPHLPSSINGACHGEAAGCCPPALGKAASRRGDRGCPGREGSGVPHKHCTACYMQKPCARRERSTQRRCRLLPSPPVPSKAIGEPAPGRPPPAAPALPHRRHVASLGTGAPPLHPRVHASWPRLRSCSRGVRHPGGVGAGGGGGDCSVYYFLNTWLYLFLLFFFYNASHR